MRIQYTPMEFEDSFFLAEDRDGFHITSMMKRVWAVELEIVNVVSEICKRHGIKWFAVCGTLLGAVREKGYIPWDDDIDLGMLRVDYERFVRFAREELPEGWNLHNFRDDMHPNASTLNIFNTEELHTDREFLELYHGCPYGVGIDIFPFDNLPEDPEEENIFHLLATLAYDCFIESENGVLYDDCSDDVKERVTELENNVGLMFDRSIPIRPQAHKYADQIATMYYDSPATEVSIIAFYTSNINNRKSRPAFDSVVMMPFENIMIPVPADYDTILRQTFGPNYMIPVKGGSDHEYPNYAGEERILRKQYEDQGLEFPEVFQ
ncbi:MAG: LicD family protein [Lachnospiraceae bacterium]|nr:LicD family protein [Lachnospiraceae bacterium]